MGLLPYRANAELKRRVDSLFRNPTNPFYRDYIDISTSGSRGLVNDMAIRAIAIARYYVTYPQQFGNAFTNIEMQILVRMWKQMFKHELLQEKPPEMYKPTKMKLLKISDGFFSELLRVVKEEDYIQSSDDMVKKRYVDGVQIGLRERKEPKKTSVYFEYLCNLE